MARRSLPGAAEVVGGGCSSLGLGRPVAAPAAGGSRPPCLRVRGEANPGVGTTTPGAATRASAAALVVQVGVTIAMPRTAEATAKIAETARPSGALAPAAAVAVAVVAAKAVTMAAATGAVATGPAAAAAAAVAGTGTAAGAIGGETTRRVRGVTEDPKAAVVETEAETAVVLEVATAAGAAEGSPAVVAEEKKSPKPISNRPARAVPKIKRTRSIRMTRRTRRGVEL